MIENIVDQEEQDIIFINTAKKFNSSAGQCLIGFSFSHPEAKERFERRAVNHNFKVTILQANDPLLKILL